jgi:hypothetical protein
VLNLKKGEDFYFTFAAEDTYMIRRFFFDAVGNHARRHVCRRYGAPNS